MFRILNRCCDVKMQIRLFLRKRTVFMDSLRLVDGLSVDRLILSYSRVIHSQSQRVRSYIRLYLFAKRRDKKG